MRALTKAMQALVDRLRARPRGVELTGRDVQTALSLAARQLATRVRRLVAHKTLNGTFQRREVWRLTKRGRALAADELSHAPSTRTSRAPTVRQVPRRGGRVGRDS